MRRRDRTDPSTAPEHLQRFRLAEWPAASAWESWCAYEATVEAWCAERGISNRHDHPAFPTRLDEDRVPDQPWDQSLI